MKTGERMSPGREQRRGSRGTDLRNQRMGSRKHKSGSKEFVRIHTDYLFLDSTQKEPGLITTVNGFTI